MQRKTLYRTTFADFR
jgi:hypothetical protein